MATGGKDLADNFRRIELNDGNDLENDSSPWTDQSSEQSSLHQTQQTIGNQSSEQSSLHQTQQTIDERTNEETLKNVQAVIVHAEADRVSAQIFKAELKRSAPDMEIETLQEFSHPGKTHFDNLDTIFENNHFVFLWVTRNLGDDKELLQMFLADISLTESKLNRERYDKFIPIWGQADAQSLYPKFKVFSGFNFHDVKDDFNKLRLLIDQANGDTGDIDLK